MNLDMETKMHDKYKKFYLEASIDLIDETIGMKKVAASVLDFPDSADKQPDLLYFKSIFVSSGSNLNGAHFTTSELVMANDTISSKAVDIEHKSESIVGHILDNAIIDSDGNMITLEDLKDSKITDVDKLVTDIEIASVIYKSRFPDLAEEVANNEWKVSMEAYYADYDIKIGDLILTKEEAASVGLDHEDDNLYGRKVIINKPDSTPCEATVARVLRDILFSGVGLVKQPANPKSLVTEVASKTILEVDLAKLDRFKASTSKNRDIDDKVADKPDRDKETAALEHNDTVNICVSYKRELIDTSIKTQDSVVLETDWCTKYSDKCTSLGGDATSPDCLQYKVQGYITSSIKEILESNIYKNKLKGSLEYLNDLNKKIKLRFTE